MPRADGRARRMNAARKRTGSISNRSPRPPHTPPILRSVLERSRRFQGAGLALRARLLGDHDPQDQIRERPEPAEKERHQKEQAKEDRVEIEIVAEPAADAGDLPVLAESMEFFHVALANFPDRGIEYQSSTPAGLTWIKPVKTVTTINMRGGHRE